MSTKVKVDCNIVKFIDLFRYDSFKDLLLSTGYFKDNLITHFSGGVMAGTVATTVFVVVAI